MIDVGSISRKYETGGKTDKAAAKIISSGKGDPGGVSYGTYQLSSTKGTLSKFLKHSGYDSYFENLSPGTREFNNQWVELVNTDNAFINAQHTFIEETHFSPLAKYAESKKISLTPKINEALWSMSVQHKKAKTIVKDTLPKINSNSKEEEIIKALYETRSAYIKKLTLKPETKKSILNRYKNEEKDVLFFVPKSREDEKDVYQKAPPKKIPYPTRFQFTPNQSSVSDRALSARNALFFEPLTGGACTVDDKSSEKKMFQEFFKL